MYREIGLTHSRFVLPGVADIAHQLTQKYVCCIRLGKWEINDYQRGSRHRSPVWEYCKCNLFGNWMFCFSFDLVVDPCFQIVNIVMGLLKTG